MTPNGLCALPLEGKMISGNTETPGFNSPQRHSCENCDCVLETNDERKQLAFDCCVLGLGDE